MELSILQIEVGAYWSACRAVRNGDAEYLDQLDLIASQTECARLRTAAQRAADKGAILLRVADRPVCA